jgi:acyl phosphate:glycerol-3-phosphate acyltransferase
MVPSAALEALSQPLVLGLAAAGYLAGSVPFGLILAKLVAGKDVRQSGSGNIGATNVARVVGKKLGVVVLVLDALKGFVPVFIASRMSASFPSGTGEFVEGCVAFAAVVGHCFPLWLKLRGGKGVATGLGVLLAHRPEVAAVGLVAFAIGFAVVRRVSVGSMLAAVAVVGAIVYFGPHDVSVAPLAACALVIVARHHGNIRRLISGKELKV